MEIGTMADAHELYLGSVGELYRCARRSWCIGGTAAVPQSWGEPGAKPDLQLGECEYALPIQHGICHLGCDQSDETVAAKNQTGSGTSFRNQSRGEPRCDVE